MKSPLENYWTVTNIKIDYLYAINESRIKKILAIVKKTIRYLEGSVTNHKQTSCKIDFSPLDNVRTRSLHLRAVYPVSNEVLLWKLLNKILTNAHYATQRSTALRIPEFRRSY